MKELKSSSSFGGRLRPAIGTSKKSTTLVVPPPKKEVIAELPSNNRYNPNHSQNHSLNTPSSKSPHRTASSVGAAAAPSAASATAGKPPPPPPPSHPNGRKTNPELVGRPLK